MPTAPGAPFAGRGFEQKWFRTAVRAGHGRQKLSTPFFPHIFVVYSGPGMGKSALLRQFQRIVTEEQPATQQPIQLIQLNLDHAHYPDADALAKTLAGALEPLPPNFKSQYHDTMTRRAQHSRMYRKLQREWQCWTKLRELGESEVDQLIQTHYQHVRSQTGDTITRKTLHGPRSRVTPVAAQTERVIDDLSDILDYHTVHNSTWPKNFNDLATHRLAANASLFEGSVAIGEALVKDLNALAQQQPLILLLDGYERAIQHDDWLRDQVLAQLDNTVIVVLASRVPPPVGYQHLFGTAQAQRVRLCDLNKPLDQSEMAAYLTARLGHASDLAEVASISHGIPLVVAALCDQLQLDGDLGHYRGVPPADTTLRSIERTIIQRFLRPVTPQHTLPNSQLSSMRDRQRIRTLALLLRPDEALICELWGVTAAEASASMRELASRYSFIFAGCAPYDMSDLVRALVREETYTRARHSLEWSPLEVGLRRGLTLVQEIAAQVQKKLGERCYDDPSWCAATLDELNFLLWLGQSGVAQQQILKHWLAARFRGVAFGDWLLSNAAALTPKTADWISLISALQTQDYDVLDRYAGLLDVRDKAILAYLQARRSQLDVVNGAKARQLDQHIELLQKGYTADPTWAPLHDTFAEALSARGHYRLYDLRDYAVALADFSAIVDLRPNDPIARHKRGIAQQAQGNLEAALEDFTAALQQPAGATAAAIHYSRGEVYHKLKQLDKAYDDFTAALTLCPADPIVLSARGRVLFDQNNLEDALADLDAATKLQKSDPDIWIDHSRVQAALGKTEDALNDIDKAITLRNGDPIAFKQRGIYKRTNDLGGAGLALDKAIDLFQTKPETLLDRGDLLEEHSDALYQRGLVRIILADPKGALDDLNESIMLHDGPDARYERALLWEARAQPPASVNTISQARHAALADLNAALAQRSGYAPALAKRGMILLLIGQPTRALKDLQASRDIRPNDLEVINALGRAHVRLGSQAQALDHFAYSLKLDPDQPEALYQRGRIFANQNKPADALRDFTRSLALRPDNAATLYQRGLVYFKQKAFAKAKQDMDAVLALNNTNLSAQYQLGRILLASGDAKLAEQSFSTILLWQPDRMDALYRRGIARLRQYKPSAIPDLFISAVHKIRR